MSFTDGFKKTAGAVGEVAEALGKGLKSAGGQTIKDTLALKGNISHFTDAAKAAGGAGKLFNTQKGRKHLAEAVGKATPGLATLGAGAYVGKKVYDKATQNDYQQGYY